MALKRYIHRDDLLTALGRMPARKAGESLSTYEHRKAVKASQVAKEHGLTAFSTGARALQYDEAEVLKIQERTVRAVAA